MEKKITIGVTDCSKYDNYADWVLSYGVQVEVIKLSEKTNNWEDVKKCHGVLFTGGEDVHPQFYGKPEYLSFCHSSDINAKRDEFEMKLMGYTSQHNIPVLGICRGMQLYNVFAGGTLIPDIPSWGKYNHSKIKNGKDRYHSVSLDQLSWLSNLLRAGMGEINSNHHQAVDKVGKDLIVCALSSDGVAEAAEWKDPDGKPFLCLVQWHPERMDDQHSDFVLKIKNAFIKASAELI